MAAVFFDIDGTLVDREQQIPDSTREAIRLLHQNGHMAFISSGRTKVMIRDENLLSLGFDGILCGCGTHIIYDGKDLVLHEIASDLMERAVELFYEYDLPAIIEGKDYLFMDADMIGVDEYGRYLLKVMADVTQPIRNNHENWCGNKYSLLIQDRNFEPVVKKLEAEFEFINHDSVAMEVVPKGYSKATGLETVCSLLQIPRKEVFAIGDGNNDIDMLEFAQVGIVMGNGKEMAKAHGDYITSDIHEDGIWNALKKYSLI